MSNSIILINYLNNLIRIHCDRTKYLDLEKGLIGIIDNEILKNLNCLKAGKSQQKVYVCNSGYVYKSQTMDIQRRLIDVSPQVVKVDSFTMNILMQQIMSQIAKDYPSLSNYIEHPIDSVCQDNNHLVLIYNASNFGDFQNYLLNHKDDPNYIQNIGKILRKVMAVNDELYKLCQFQHCDMKCMQILLNKDNNGNISPILSDFDKSTFTLLTNDKSVRIRLDPVDTAATGEEVGKTFYMNKGGGRKNKKRIRKTKRVRKTSRIRKNKRVRKTNRVRKSKKRTKRKRGGSIKSKLKSLGLRALHKFSPTSLKKKAYGKQGLQRFEDKPFKDNNFYNACLLSSMLLLYDSSKNINQDIFVLDRELGEYKYLLHHINMDLIHKLRLKHNYSKLSGNSMAASCVISKSFEENDILQSKVRLT